MRFTTRRFIYEYCHGMNSVVAQMLACFDILNAVMAKDEKGKPIGFLLPRKS